MLYCPPNVTFSDVWGNNGVSHCFLDTVTSATYGIFLTVFGFGQWLVYKRYASLKEVFIIRPKSVLMTAQFILFALMPLLAVLHLILLATVIGDKTIYGYELVFFTANIISWPLCARLVLLERYNKLSTDSSRRHGFVLLTFWLLVFIAENVTFMNLENEDWWFNLSNASDKCEFAIFVLRYTFSCLLLIIGFIAPALALDASGAQLNEKANQNGNTDYTNEGSTFSDLYKKLRMLLPFLWPKENIMLQLDVIFCMLLLVAGRVINVFVPYYNKEIVDSLGGDGTEPTFCWGLVLTYSGLKFLSCGGVGSMGVLNNLRTLAWIPVQQYTSREIQVSLFSHLHSLSLRWHLSRKTGEVLRVMDRGTQSIHSLLSSIVFNIAPTIVDLLVAIVYFTLAFNYMFGVIVFVTMILYVGATIVVTEWRTKFRRSMNLADNEQRTKAVDSLLNFETVKYYGAEQYEVDQYKSAILEFQSEEMKSTASLCLLNNVQNFFISGGFLVGSLLCVYYVSDEKHSFTVGDYVLFASYVNQLYIPLNWFGTYYRNIQQNFVDLELMLELLREDHEIKDSPKAVALVAPQGRIEFRNVSFSYLPEKKILDDISFVVEPGQTMAIVGSTGEGKSTIIRLVFRFYDVTSGNVLVDGKDVRELTQTSLRQNIGVVPQDTVLFNDTIEYNIKYGKFICNDEEVQKAATYADIHDKILNFPDKYETEVGERGLKLSGGEKQRVAIARTILKAPTFLLLDEATSALDTKTERNIQSALNTVCQGRTVIVVAHRLSTIIHADSILVLKDGRVAEQGKHADLIARNGVYADMWRQQLSPANIDLEVAVTNKKKCSKRVVDAPKCNTGCCA